MLKVRKTNLHSREANTDEEVGQPIDEHGNGHGSWPRSLGEQLSRDHPGYGSRPNREEHNEAQDRYDRQVRHPVYHFLYVTKKLLSGR